MNRLRHNSIVFVTAFVYPQDLARPEKQTLVDVQHDSSQWAIRDWPPHQSVLLQHLM